MGRHRAPLPEGTALPRAPIAIGVAALLIVLALLVGVFVATRGGGDDEVTTRPSTKPSSQAPSPTATLTPTASATAPASAPASTKAKRAPTLRLLMTGTSYVTVRLPNGRTLVSKTFRKGARRTFDQKQLRVILGSSGAVQVTVNGTPRKRGRTGQVDTFTVRRK